LRFLTFNFFSIIIYLLDAESLHIEILHCLLADSLSLTTLANGSTTTAAAATSNTTTIATTTTTTAAACTTRGC
jgi:hypothetical protein